MNTRDIEAFLTVVDAGSIMAAASRLHLTQPAVTRRIQGLEQSLGAELLDRQSKPLKPTTAGRNAYELGRRVLGSVQDLRSGMAANGDVIGEFRLGVTPSQSDDTLTGPLDSLRKSYPQLTLLVSTAWSHELVDHVAANRIDAALVYLPGDTAIPSTLEATPITRNRVCVVAPKSFGLGGKRLSLADVAEHSWLLSQDGCGFRRTLKQALARAGLPFVVAVESFNAELRMALVARGIGLGLTTEQTLARSKHRNAVDVLDLRDFKSDIRVQLVHRVNAGRLAAPLAEFGAMLKGLHTEGQNARTLRRQ